MEKPCCFRCRDSSDINGAEFCNNPSCKCHLPKEKCECAKDMQVEDYENSNRCCNCGLPIQRIMTISETVLLADQAENRPKQPPAPEKEAGKGYCIECDLETQPQMLCKCPFRAEKKWEERFWDDFGDVDSISLHDQERVKSFIRQLLEEKAVEVESLKEIVPDPNIDDSVWPIRVDGFNAGIDEAAAILRR